MEKYDFSGWATRNDLLCADGRTIRKDAFRDNDGQTVPLVWNHTHEPDHILGHALLENREDGVYAYCTFNNSESGQAAREAVKHGDVKSLSIYANKLKQSGKDVLHGMIREVSLVMAGANPGAFIDFVMAHGEDTEEGFYAGYDENIVVHYYAEEEQPMQHVEDKPAEEQPLQHVEDKAAEEQPLQHAEDKAEDKKEDKTDMADTKEEKKPEAEAESEAKEKTVGDVWQGILDKTTEEEQTVIYAMIDQAMQDAENKKEEVEHSEDTEGGNVIMHKNVFDREDEQQGTFLSHADEMEIMSNARACGSFKKAIAQWGNDHLEHGFGASEGETIDMLFTDLKNVPAGAPTLLERDMDWVATVMAKANKSPIARVRTRQIDARAAEITAKAHKKGEQKKVQANVKLLKRETHPQTVYVKDALHRDDIIDIDFDSVAYMRNIMKHTLEETVALAAMVGDFRNEEANDKISDQCIRPIWSDDELYVIHKAVDVAAMKTKLQGTGTAANFGDEFVRTEAIIAALMDGRIQYKGKGTADFYCEPALLNTMLLARDMNGRRIYESAADVAKVLNVGHVYTVEQFAGLTRENEDGQEVKLLGIFVNMNNYQFGCAKGGEITSFEDFDIDYNQYKYLMETRLSGALIDPYSAIVLEEIVSAAG